MTKNYKLWLDSFMYAWQQRDVETIMNIISKHCIYFETVFDTPCSSFDNIKKLWEVVPKNQKNIEYNYEILIENDKLCIVNFFVKRMLIPSEVKQQINGIFQIPLDEDNKCCFFKQWRAIKKI